VPATVSEREYIERILSERDQRYSERFDAQEKAVAAALAAAKEAVIKAEVATEKRLEGVNEFRQSLEDQQKTFVRQDVFNVISAQVIESKGRGAGRNDIWLILVVIASLVISVATPFIHH
jgi:hypothetical protein